MPTPIVLTETARYIELKYLTREAAESIAAEIEAAGFGEAIVSRARTKPSVLNTYRIRVATNRPSAILRPIQRFLKRRLQIEVNAP
jgi:hypothetical protein